MNRLLAGSLAAALLSLSTSEGIGRAPPAEPSLNAFVDDLAATFTKDPAQFQRLAGGPSIFDSINAGPDDRLFGLPKIITADPKHGTAVLLLSADVKLPNSGDATFYSSLWSGIHPAHRGPNGWILDARIPFGANRIMAHDIDLVIDPMHGITVRDQIDIDVRSPHGFATMLNVKSAIAGLSVDGKPADYDFQNGLLWIRCPSANIAWICDTRTR
jgi:hypothetical protein